jgi:hypothetical protein
MMIRTGKVWSLFLFVIVVICSNVGTDGFYIGQSGALSRTFLHSDAEVSARRFEQTSRFRKTVCSASDGMFEALFKSIFPSAEERRKTEVKIRRAWSSSVAPKLQDSGSQESTTPKTSNYVPPELSESNKVDIGICAIEFSYTFPMN